jgi:hypothetical protein
LGRAGRDLGRLFLARFIRLAPLYARFARLALLAGLGGFIILN